MKKILLASATAAMLIAAPAFAQGYVGLGIGSASLTGLEGNESGSTYSGGNSAKTSMKIFGGYQITPMWGVEAQYATLGKRDFVESVNNNVVFTESFKTSQFSIAATGKLPLSSSFDLIGKLGVSANSVKFDGQNESATGLMYGIGVTYKLTPAIAIRAEYEDFGKLTKEPGINGASIKAKNYSLGLQYSF